MRRWLAVTVLALGFAAPAYAAAPLEQKLQEAAGVPVKCYDPIGWAARTAAFGMPANTLGLVAWDVGDIELAPKVCAALEQFVTSPPQARCQTGTTTITKYVWKWRKVKGKRKRVRVAVRLTVPQYGVCPVTADQVEALHTVTHERQHARGVRDETTADCAGLQDVADLAVALGAAPEAARVAAQWSWMSYDLLRTPGYWSSDCRQNGPLDRTPGDGIWP